MNKEYKRVDIKTGFICNNNCKFCVQADNKCKGNRSFEEIKKDLIESRKRCEGVVLTGGEVTIRKDFFEIVTLAKEIGYKSIQIQTNGRMFSSLEFCKKTIEAGATEFSPAIHGYCAEQHDFLTQSKGSFNQTVKGIKNLKSLGAYVITNTVVVKPNYATIPEIAKLLFKLKVDQFQFAFVHPMGNALKNFENIVPSISLAAPYICKGLQRGINAKIKVMAEAMPYCLMKGYEKYIAENVMPETEIKGKEYQNTISFTKQRKEEGKLKFPQCNQCKYNLICEGPWREYPEKRGNSEFIPIIEKPDIAEEKLLSSFFEKDYYNFLALITVLSGKRKICRMVISEEKAKRIIPYLKRRNLYWEILPRSKTKDAFTFEGGKNKYKCSQEDLEVNKENNLYFYVSRELNKIKELKNSEINGNPVENGKLLGYPKCCIEKYDLRIKEGKISDLKIINDLIDKKEERAYFPFYTNCNSYGRTLIPHFPCSYDCQESIKMAKENLETIENIDKKLKEKIIFYLTRPMFISEDFLINFKLKKIEFQKNYSKEEFAADGIKTESVLLINQNKIKINGQYFDGKLIFFE